MKINGGHNYKIDDKQLTEIINKNVKPVDSEFTIEFNIFCKIRTLKNIIIKNNPHEPTCKFNVVYLQQMGMYRLDRTDFIEERFRHQSVKKHLREEHNIALIKPTALLQSVEVLYQDRSKQELLVMEELFIDDRNLILKRRVEIEC